jgi:hypothetical protein
MNILNCSVDVKDGNNLLSIKILLKVKIENRKFWNLHGSRMKLVEL